MECLVSFRIVRLSCEEPLVKMARSVFERGRLLTDRLGDSFRCRMHHRIIQEVEGLGRHGRGVPLGGGRIGVRAVEES